jgi:hypothetical protein
MHYDTFEELMAEVRTARLEWTEEMRKDMNRLLESLDADTRISGLRE